VQNHTDIELQVALYPCNYFQHPTYGSKSRLYA
jgi:hypothetical protein